MVDALTRVWVQPRSPGRVQLSLGGLRFSCEPAEAIDLARQLIAAVDALDEADDHPAHHRSTR